MEKNTSSGVRRMEELKSLMISLNMCFVMIMSNLQRAVRPLISSTRVLATGCVKFICSAVAGVTSLNDGYFPKDFSWKR